MCHKVTKQVSVPPIDRNVPSAPFITFHFQSYLTKYRSYAPVVGIEKGQSPDSLVEKK
jgi:hypothetical protein